MALRVADLSYFELSKYSRQNKKPAPNHRLLRKVATPPYLPRTATPETLATSPATRCWSTARRNGGSTGRRGRRR